jgi:hypothetical protein
MESCIKEAKHGAGRCRTYILKALNGDHMRTTWSSLMMEFGIIEIGYGSRNKQVIHYVV